MALSSRRAFSINVVDLRERPGDIVRAYLQFVAQLPSACYYNWYSVLLGLVIRSWTWSVDRSKTW